LACVEETAKIGTHGILLSAVNGLTLYLDKRNPLTAHAIKGSCFLIISIAPRGKEGNNS